MSIMRAKMRVTRVRREEAYEELHFSAVCKADGYPEGGSDENNTFAKFTPTADLQMTVTNPAMVGKIGIGEEYYLDFTKAE